MFMWYMVTDFLAAHTIVTILYVYCIIIVDISTRQSSWQDLLVGSWCGKSCACQVRIDSKYIEITNCHRVVSRIQKCYTIVDCLGSFYVYCLWLMTWDFQYYTLTITFLLYIVDTPYLHIVNVRQLYVRRTWVVMALYWSMFVITARYGDGTSRDEMRAYLCDDVVWRLEWEGWGRRIGG